MTSDPQLRLSLRALHQRAVFLGPQRNFYILLALLSAAAGAVIYFLPADGAWGVFLIIGPGFLLHRHYFIELPASKSLLTFFESNHPELCSWRPDSALREATLAYAEKKLVAK